MNMGTDRSSHSAPPEAYWRRRAIALAGVLATVGLVAWACSGGKDGDRDGNRDGSLRNAAVVSTPTPTPTPFAMPTITVTATAKVTVRSTAPRRDGDVCAPADVVASLTPTAESYRDKAKPQFRLSVVNTGDRSCTLDVGPKALEIRVTSGSDRVWSSADCIRGSGSSIRLFKRGIPYLSTVTWDRRRSSDGCTGSRDLARPGTYVVAAKAGKLKVQRQVFRLR
jgi:hypothetical protein